MLAKRARLYLNVTNLKGVNHANGSGNLWKQKRPSSKKGQHEKSRANSKAKDIACIIKKQNYEIKKERQVNGAGFVC